MILAKKRFLAVLIFILLAVPIVSASIKGAGGNYTIIVNEQAQMGHWHDNGLTSYRARVILGQRFTGEGRGAFGVRRVLLGYIYMLDDRPEVTAEILADKVDTKHPYTNDTLKCEIKITDEDIGDTLNISVKWYTNSSSDWYQNDVSDIDYTNIEALTTSLSVNYGDWPDDTENIIHTLIASTAYDTNTSVIGNVEPIDTYHYDVWKCSVNVFDGVKHSGWVNSSPLMVYNHKPDFDYSMPTYYDFAEDTVNSIMLSTYYSDIDNDDINWYLSQSSGEAAEQLTIESVDIAINNITGEVVVTPAANATGFIDITFTAVDNRPEIPGSYLQNDDGHSDTHSIRLNISQVNDAPWPSDVYIEATLSGSQSPLECNYIYNDIEGFDENLSEVSFIWYINDEGDSSWTDLGINSSILDIGEFDLEDELICSARVKDIYITPIGIDESLYSVYVNSTTYTVQQEIETPTGGGEIVIGVG